MVGIKKAFDSRLGSGIVQLLQGSDLIPVKGRESCTDSRQGSGIVHLIPVKGRELCTYSRQGTGIVIHISQGNWSLIPESNVTLDVSR